MGGGLAVLRTAGRVAGALVGVLRVERGGLGGGVQVFGGGGALGAACLGQFVLCIAQGLGALLGGELGVAFDFQARQGVAVELRLAGEQGVVLGTVKKLLAYLVAGFQRLAQGTGVVRVLGRAQLAQGHAVVHIALGQRQRTRSQGCREVFAHQRRQALFECGGVCRAVLQGFCEQCLQRVAQAVRQQGVFTAVGVGGAAGGKEAALHGPRRQGLACTAGWRCRRAGHRTRVHRARQALL